MIVPTSFPTSLQLPKLAKINPFDHCRNSVGHGKSAAAVWTFFAGRSQTQTPPTQMTNCFTVSSFVALWKDWKVILRTGA